MMNQYELPPDFPHKPPKDYSYEVESFRSNVLRIWIINHGTFSYTDTAPRSVWGFVKTKHGRKGSTTTTYHAPINANRVGKVVDIENTTPYSAMQLNLNPLESALYNV